MPPRRAIEVGSSDFDALASEARWTSKSEADFDGTAIGFHFSRPTPDNPLRNVGRRVAWPCPHGRAGVQGRQHGHAFGETTPSGTPLAAKQTYLAEPLQQFLRPGERLLITWEKDVPYPVLGRRKFLAIAFLANKQGPKSTPVCVPAGFQVLPCLVDRVLKRLDSIKNGLSLTIVVWRHEMLAIALGFIGG